MNHEEEYTLGELVRLVRSTNRGLEDHRAEAAKHRNEIHQYAIRVAELTMSVGTLVKEGAELKTRVDKIADQIKDYDTRLETIEQEIKDLRRDVEKTSRYVTWFSGAMALAAVLLKLVPWGALWK